MDEGEEHRFGTWWERIEPGLQRAASRIAGPFGNDIIQDIAVLAFRNWSRFETHEGFAKWCYVRARWLALDELARRRRHPTESIDVAEAELVAPDDQWPGPEVLSILDTLPSQQRNVAAYKLIGYDSEEIAEKLGIKVQTVRSHWRFALKSLSTRMGES